MSQRRNQNRHRNQNRNTREKPKPPSPPPRKSPKRIKRIGLFKWTERVALILALILLGIIFAENQGCHILTRSEKMEWKK